LKKKQKLDGGNMSSVYRQGETVARSQGKWSPTIHRLLRHLENTGFTDCPKFIGINDQLEEVLTFVSGDCLTDYPANISKEKHLEGIRILAEKMRKFHDVTASFIHQSDDTWMLNYSGNLEKEVICHNDIAPYNVTFENGLPKGLIDFDTCCPAPRIWDIVYALYRFVPFSEETAYQNADHKLSCVATFFESYGMSQPDDLFFIMQERLTALADFILQEATNGNDSFKKMLDEGHHDLYLSEISYLKKNWENKEAK